MKHENITKAGIDELMEIFYEQIRHHAELGAIFNAKVGTSEAAWDKHKAKIGNFWMGMLLGEGDYAGQPMKAHLELPPFPQSLFNEWLGLFEQSLKQVFTDDVAAQILFKAQMIAQNFQRVLYAGG